MKKDNPRIFIAVNDADKAVSSLWNLVKGICSRRKETAAETARRVLIRGLTAELEEINLATNDGNNLKNGSEHPDLFKI